MLAWLLAATSITAVDAELAFARDAQRIGQWTAFRKYADETAVMFNPQAVWARDFLASQKDPSKAITWAPSESWVSCDGRTAINRGPWRSPIGGKGYFTTVWVREEKLEVDLRRWGYAREAYGAFREIRVFSARAAAANRKFAENIVRK